MSLLSCGYLPLGMQPPLKSSLFPDETFLEKTKFYFASGYQLETDSEFAMGYMSISFSARTPSAAGPVHAASVSEFRCGSTLLMRRPCLPGVLFSSVGFTEV